VRRLAYEAADAGLLSPELAAGIQRVKGARKLGSRLGNWLTTGEASALWQLPDSQTLTGNGIERFLRSCSVVGSVAANSRSLFWKTCSVARNAGPLSTWLAKEGTYEPCLYRIG
jgi:hypothetical protein